MTMLIRLARAFPLLAVLAVLALVIYLILSRSKSPEYAKETLILIFTRLTIALAVFFGVFSLYAWFEGHIAALELAGAFALVSLLALGITRWCNYVFLRNHPHFRRKPVKAKTKFRWPF